MLTHMKSDGAFSAGGKKNENQKRLLRKPKRQKKAKDKKMKKFHLFTQGMGLKIDLFRPFTYTPRWPWVSTRRT